MKKRIALALFVLMLFSCAAADDPALDAMTDTELFVLYGNVVAEIMHRNAPQQQINPTSGVITFRGIPWGTSASEALEILRSGGLSGSIEASSCPSWEFKDYQGKAVSRYSLSSPSGRMLKVDNELTVGGYPATTTQLFFMQGFDDENVYDDDAKSTFYLGRYYLKPGNYRAAFDQLIEKLSLLYGNGVRGTYDTHWRSSGGDYTSMSEWVVWYGSNDTAVRLEYRYEITDAEKTVRDEQLTLNYGKSNSILLMQELEAAQTREETEAAASSFDGL